MDVYDLSGTIPSQEEGENEHFSATEVPGNPTWTQITVKQTRNNYLNNLRQEDLSYKNIPSVIDIARSTSETKTAQITSSPGSTPVDDTSSSARLSAVTRLSSSIALPLPKGLTLASSNDWGGEETSILEKMIGNLSTGIPSIEEMAQKGVDWYANTRVRLASGTSFKKFVQNQGLASNPYKEMFYGGIGFRSFSFSWEIAPKSEAEAKTLERLIYQLELASHPEYTSTDASAFWIPDSFELEFKGTNIPKLEPLVLTSMSVDYSQYGPKFIREGYPAFVGLDLNFMEVTIRTKQEVKNAWASRNLPEVSFS